VGKAQVANAQMLRLKLAPVGKAQVADAQKLRLKLAPVGGLV